MKNELIKRQTFAAFQGFFVIQEDTDDKGFPIAAYLEPVIGWEIEDGSNQPIPLTPSGCDFDPLDILYPDGSVRNPFTRCYNNIDEWLKEKQDEYQVKQERKADHV